MHATLCRYTIVKNGPRRLFVPNSAFLTREFMVMDDPSTKNAKRDLGADGQAPQPPLLGFPFSRR